MAETINTSNNTPQATASPEQLEQLLEAALAYHQDGDLVRAEAVYRRILEQDSKHFTALYNMTLLANSAKKYEIALIYANRAIKAMPQVPETVAMLGNTLLSLKKYDAAAGCFEKAIQLNPEYALAHYNLALCQSKLKKYDAAITSYERALAVDPNDPDVYNNLGGVYEAKGLLSRASKSYLGALKMQPYELKSSYNYATCLFLMQRFRELHRFIAETEDKGALSPVQMTGLYILDAIVLWLEGDFDACAQVMQVIKNVEYTKESFPNYFEFSTYCIHLEKLLKYQEYNMGIYEAAVGEPVYFIGDSHCLAGTYVPIRWYNAPHVLVPSLIMGTQAKYLADAEDNKFKAAFRIAMDSIPNNAHAMVSFGELDCRLDYGIIPQQTKLGQTDEVSLKAAAGEIIERYVRFAIQEAERKRISIVFLGTPAPTVGHDGVTFEEGALIKQTVRLFNEKLSEILAAYNRPFIDIYHATVGSDGFGRKDLYLDDFHLKPHVLANICSGK